MYVRNTILVRKEPFTVPVSADPSNKVEEVEGDPRHPYNRVRVIGPSPVSHSGGPGMWEGASARGVSIEPLTQFASNVDRPYGELQAEYTIEFEPEPLVLRPEIRVVDSQTRQAGPTPEEVFAAMPVVEPTAPKVQLGRRVNKRAPKAAT